MDKDDDILSGKMDEDDAIVSECIDYILKQQVNELMSSENGSMFRLADDIEYKESDDASVSNEELYNQLVKIISMNHAMMVKSIVDITGYY